MISTSWGTATDRGTVRQLNEDALLAYPPVFLVADGMGGHEAGEVASRIAVEEFTQLAGRESVTAAEVHDCMLRTAARVQAIAGDRTVGTTIAGVAVATHDDEPYWLVFNIGDSRVYRCAGGVLEQISVDHSVVQDLIDTGRLDESLAQDHPDGHVITRVVGAHQVPDPEYWLLPADPDDRLLLCTDGLSGELADRDLLTGLLAHPDPQDAARWLVAAALAAGGRDNVSAVVVDVARRWSGRTDVGSTIPAGGPPLDDSTIPAGRKAQ